MAHGLTSKPWHNPHSFPWVARLEENWHRIRDELKSLCSDGVDGGAWPEVRGYDRGLTQGTGVWREFPILGLGTGSEARAQLQCPYTYSLLSEIDAIRSHADLQPMSETAIFSRLSPGTHLKPHCGPTNTHLTLHLGLQIPDGCSIRCGAEVRHWKEGECIIFDDSYEHEVWHHGSSVRFVLLIRFWHPDVPPAQRVSLLREDVRGRRDKGWVLL